MTQPQPEAMSPSFSAILTPHRSLSPTGFVVLMTAICVVSFGTGLFFFMLGAWPVVGFLGLDVLVIYIAFKLSYRSGRCYETVELSPEELTVTRVDPVGREQSWRFNPYWVRLKLAQRVGLSSELSISSHGKRLVFGSFLTDPEREEFAGALSAALTCAKGPQAA
jgi:uncharacterized membrane protein